MPENPSAPNRLVGILGQADYERLLESLQATRQRGQLLPWQKDLLERITTETGEEYRTADQFLRAFEKANLHAGNMIERRFLNALLMTGSFAITALACGSLWAFIHANWIWQHQAHSWAQTRAQVCQHSMWIVAIFSACVTAIFGFFVLPTAFLYGKFAHLSLWRLITYGFVWGAVLWIGLVALFIELARNPLRP